MNVELVYSSVGRIAHAWVITHRGQKLAPHGICVTDDFGNSVQTSNAPLLHYLRQSH